jgi:hypothetical protein
MGKLTEHAQEVRSFPSHIMKPSLNSKTPHHRKRFNTLRLSAAVCLLSPLITVPAAAQSAANFTKQVPKAAATVSAAPETAAKPAEILPSRYVTPEQLPSYVNAVTEILSIRKRETDPFGQYQDPSARPVVKPTVAKLKRYTPAQATPFSDIVRLIKVTTVMPSEKSFLVGTRTFSEGDRIPLSFRGKTLNAEVAAVASSAIEFRNTDNGERASLRLNLLPVGMTPGNDGNITAPGMVQDRPDTPIDLDVSSL